MPVTGFLCPKCNKSVPIEEAQEHFADVCAVMYHGSVQAIINNLGDERRALGAGVSASQGSPEATCRRQVVLERFVPYSIDIRMQEDAEEGSNYHSAFHKRGAGGVWAYETPLPGPADAGKPGVRRNAAGFYEYELWPDVWFSCMVDAHKNWKWIDDLKTARPAKSMRCPKCNYYQSGKIWPPGNDNKAQLMLAKVVAERLGYGPVEQLRIWKYVRGCYEAAERHHPFVIMDGSREHPFWSEAQLEQHCREHLSSMASMVRTAEALQGEPGWMFDAWLKANVPLDGLERNLFNGKKCTMYCSVKDICFQLAGKARV